MKTPKEIDEIRAELKAKIETLIADFEYDTKTSVVEVCDIRTIIKSIGRNLIFDRQIKLTVEIPRFR